MTRPDSQTFRRSLPRAIRSRPAVSVSLRRARQASRIVMTIAAHRRGRAMATGCALCDSSCRSLRAMSMLAMISTARGAGAADERRCAEQAFRFHVGVLLSPRWLSHSRPSTYRILGDRRRKHAWHNGRQDTVKRISTAAQINNYHCRRHRSAVIYHHILASSAICKHHDDSLS